jgi:hypothetical protein
MAHQTQRPVADIIGDLFSQTTTLFGKETQLMRAELSENVGRVGRGIGLLVAGAVLLIPALVILLQAATAALTQTMQLQSYWSALIVGGVTLLVGLILVLAGSGRLRAEELMPDRTVRQLRRDARVVKQQVGGDSDIQRAA